MLHGLVAICHEAGNGRYIGSHCPKQLRAPSLLGGEELLRFARMPQSQSVVDALNLSVSRKQHCETGHARLPAILTD